MIAITAIICLTIFSTVLGVFGLRGYFEERDRRYFATQREPVMKEIERLRTELRELEQKAAWKR